MIPIKLIKLIYHTMKTKMTNISFLIATSH